MSKSPDSFTFTVGKLGTCTLSDLSWLSVTRLSPDAGMAVRVSANGDDNTGGLISLFSC